MSVTYKLDTSGLDALMTNLDTNLAGALTAIAYVVMGNAVMLAPVDTGALKNSIHVEHVSQTVKHVTDGVDYGIYQELGTSDNRPQPFMVPAVEQAANQVGAIVAQEVFGE